MHTKTNKTEWSLLPWDELEGVARALMAGNRDGRAPGDWKVKQTRLLCVNAAFRHLIAYARGERYDENNVKHLSQAIARLLMADFFDNQGDK